MNNNTDTKNELINTQKRGTEMKCSICKQEGHNKLSCKMTTPVSTSEIEVKTDIKVEPVVKVEMNIDKQILENMNSKSLTNKTNLIASLHLKYPKLSDWSDDEIKELCDNINSHAQSQRCINGGNFEKCIEQILSDKGVEFNRQVPIDKDGYITDTKKNNKIVDFIIGNPIVKHHISEYIVLSLKTSTRERYSEDDWTKVHKPKVYIYGTLKSDYPSPEKFEENETRKLLCVTPKKVDTRKFKLGFNDLFDLIHE
jgi:hypothetical protein